MTEMIARAAATLVERLAGQVTRVAEPDGRLRAWRAQEPFAEDRWWAARLAEVGVDEERFAAVLAEPVSAELTPVWAADIAAALAAPDDEATPTDAWDAGPARAMPFLGVAVPLLAAAKERLAGQVTDPFVVDELYRALPVVVHQMLQRAAIFELDRARRAGTLAGDTPRQRFGAFVRRLGTAAGRRAFLEAYPVLARQIAVGARLWQRSSEEFAGRLHADLPAISGTFGGDPGAIERISGGLGDRHRGWSTVMSVRWSRGLELIYKPRSVGVDVHFQRLLEWVNARGVSLPFRTLGYLDSGTHGWVERVVPRPCAGDEELHRFYRRQGGLLALLHVLHATDFHSENLIAAGDQPVLVDLESLCEPGFPFDGPVLSSAERLVADETRGSVLGVGLLPSRLWVIQTGRGIDISGLGQVPGAPSPLAVPVVVDAGQDTMRIRLEQIGLDVNDHRPVAADVPLSILDYAGDILDGFSEVYGICVDGRDELLAPDGPVAAFTGDEVRVVLRPTMWYGAMMLTGLHPDLLRDGLTRDRHFDRLWRTVPQRVSLAGCIPAERRDMWQGDVPIFTASTDGDFLCDSAREPVPGVVLRPGLARVRDRLAALGDDDLVRQRWLIRSSLATTVIEASDRPPLPSYEPVVNAEPLPADRLLAVADVLGYRLARIGFATADSAQWLGVNSDHGVTWSVGPLQADLFHGLTGVALFLGWLGALTGDPDRTALARKALATATHQIELRGELDGTAGLAGLPGAIYAVCHLSQLLDDESLVDSAVAWLDRLDIEADVDLDFTAGAAGTIAALRVLYRLRPQDRVLDAIRRSADRLVATAQRRPAGVGWLPRLLADTGKATMPIAGFAHGVAGIAWPLFEAGALLGDERYTTTARAAVAYEQDLFRPDLGRWAELRATDIAQDRPPVAWCYGAMGIGLSRVLCLPFLRDDPLCGAEIDTAIATTVQQGFGQCHALCHGDIGNVELLLHAADALGLPAYRAEADRRVAAAVASAVRQGWVCGTPLGVETPGLMVGLAGTGYGLLRMAAPDRVPAVLTLAP